jgi:hypothetical protein
VLLTTSTVLTGSEFQLPPPNRAEFSEMLLPVTAIVRLCHSRALYARYLESLPMRPSCEGTKYRRIVKY